METTNKSTFIFHYRDIPQWLKQSPLCFHLLAEFARRARRKEGEVAWRGESILLKPREFITGRVKVSEDLGMTEGEYRSAYAKLRRYGLIQTISATKRRTIAKLLDKGIFNINSEGELPSEQPLKKPTGNQKITTNNNDNNEKNVKYTANAVEDKSFSGREKEYRNNPDLRTITRNKGLESLRDHLVSQGIIGNPKGDIKKWQYEANRIAKKLDIQNPSTSWFKIFKEAFQANRQGLLQQVAASIIDAPDVRDKEKYFFKAFHHLVKGK